MKNILYYLFPILGLLFLISCEDDDDAAKDSFMLTHADTKWKFTEADTTEWLHIDMDKIHDYIVDDSDSNCCTWSTATGTHTDCDGHSYTNRMLVNKGDSLHMDIIYGSTTMADENVLMVVNGNTMIVKITHPTFTESITYTKTTDALPSVTCVP
tara:strand:+ start:137 stop:601 length:465 start_codon:yes stop_codon:yes gene_type:complete